MSPRHPHPVTHSPSPCHTRPQPHPHPRATRCGATSSVVQSGEQLRQTLSKGLPLRSTRSCHRPTLILTRTLAHTLAHTLNRSLTRTLTLSHRSGAALDSRDAGQSDLVTLSRDLRAHLRRHGQDPPDRRPGRFRAQLRDALREDQGLPARHRRDQQVAHGPQGLLPGGGKGARATARSACGRAPRRRRRRSWWS